MDLTDVVLDNLTINSDALTSLNTLSSVAITLDITTNNDNFNLTTDTPVVNFNSSITHNLNLSTTTATDMNLTTNVDSINFVAPTTEVNIFGDNLNNLEGNANTININNTETGTLTVDMDLTSFLISSNSYSQIDFTGVRTINDTIINGYLLTDINTNSVTMDSLSLLNIGLDINIETEVDVLSIETTLPINATLNYGGNTLLDLTLSGIDGMEITANLSSEVTLSGDSVDLTLIGNIIDTVDTTLLTVSNKYTMNNTLINDLGFISTGLAASLVELEVNTLDSINTTSIVEALRDSGITLFSPITETDIYDDFYDSEFADLTAQEALDSLRYNGFRDTAILDAFTEIRTNTYFDHILDGELNTIIDDQSYGDMQIYYDGYLLDIGKIEQDLIDENPGDPNFVQDIKDSIQATLDETVLVIVELDLTNSVNQSIIDDSTTYATTESDLVGFTIG